ncbi:NepR family anti-sigma factor [Ensifer sp. ZNC0028]|uniref:NepR family anti-sigma factor n=1 Tax=Ensifer sp. ZNC0028 TaxID=1339236 RepID=UPI0005BB3941|nr:NepR family anti-sigma factor [Ensifer sp. ZNC0028]
MKDEAVVKRSMDDETGKHEGVSQRRGGTAETRDIGGSIGASLKAFYRSLEQEPVPELFLNLLEKLDEAEAASKGPSKGGVPL